MDQHAELIWLAVWVVSGIVSSCFASTVLGCSDDKTTALFLMGPIGPLLYSAQLAYRYILSSSGRKLAPVTRYCLRKTVWPVIEGWILLLRPSKRRTTWGDLRALVSEIRSRPSPLSFALRQKLIIALKKAGYENAAISHLDTTLPGCGACVSNDGGYHCAIVRYIEANDEIALKSEEISSEARLKRLR